MGSGKKINSYHEKPLEIPKAYNHNRLRKDQSKESIFTSKRAIEQRPSMNSIFSFSFILLLLLVDSYEGTHRVFDIIRAKKKIRQLIAFVVIHSPRRASPSGKEKSSGRRKMMKNFYS